MALWRDFPARLSAATGCGALVYSRSGYGRSDPCDLPRPIDFMHPEAVAVLPRLLAAKKVQDHILIGHSDGGSIALTYAGQPAIAGLRGVITEAAHVFCESLSVSSIRKARTRYLKEDLRRKLEKYHGPNTDCAFWGWNDVWLHPDFKQWNIERGLPHISVPLLVLQGDRDPYGTWKQVEAIEHQAGGPVTVIRLQDCGHCPHQEQPEIALRVMAEFIHQTVGRTISPAPGL